MVPLARHSQGDARGTQISIRMETGAYSPWILAMMPVHLCTLPIPVCWSWRKGEAASGAWCCMDADCYTSASPLVDSLTFAKAFQRKGKLCSFFLSFLSSCSCVLLPLCGELLCCVHAARRKLSGCGAAAPSGNCSYQTGLCQKGIIIIIKHLMVSRGIRRYSCSRGLTCSSWHFLSLYGEF